MMKHVLWVALALLLVSGALAAGSLTATRTSVGTVSSKAKQTISGTFTLQNTGGAAVAAALPATVILTGNESKTVPVTYSQSSPLNINAGITESVSFSLVVPNDLVTGTYTPVFNITAGAGNFDAFSLQLTQKQALTIEDLDFKVDTRDANNKVNGEKINEAARPGDPVIVTVRVKNNFPDVDPKIDMNNILITVAILNIADEDIEEESDEFDLDADDDASKTFRFAIPEEVDEGDYEVMVFVEGTDDDGIEHTIDWRLELEVDKQSHDTQIKRAEFIQPQVQCGNVANLDIQVVNFGSSEEDETRLKITNSELGISILERDFHLDTDLLEDESKFSKRFQIPIPSTAKPGTYTVRTEMFIDVDSLDDFVDRNLVVTCPSAAAQEPEQQESQEEQEQQQQPGEGQQETAPQTNGGSTTVITESVEDGGSNYLIPLVIGNVIVLALIAAVAIVLSRRKKTL
ncbi:MAG TPA: hypothetical protein VJC16_03945 [Candidatus Nanoarchaeia archaeon]|nr:hypothetical protein [Candidatus Nanoarchaeia archaeon]